MYRGSIIVFDLEWNGGYGEVKLNEIFEFGAVKLERFGGPVVDTFQAFVRPAAHKKLNTVAQLFAPSKAELEAGDTFAEVLERFLAWCGEDSVYATWGACDLQELSANVSYWGIDVALPECVYDIQAASGLMAGTTNRIALHRMVEYLGIPNALDFHNALNDSFYAAVITEIISTQGREEVLWRSVIPNLRGIDIDELPSYVIYTGEQYTGFQEETAVLSGMGIRRQRCPECGGPLLIHCWYPLEEHAYISRATCPEHGDQFFWCAITQQKNRLWRGRVQVLRPESAIKALYSAQDKACMVQCRRSRHRKRKEAYWRYHLKMGKQSQVKNMRGM